MGDTTNSKLFELDSGDYDILSEGVAMAPEGGLFLEIGLRRGGGMKFILDGIARRGIHANVVSLDCYGHMPYHEREGVRDDHDYTDEMRNETLPGLYEYVRGKPINFLFFNLTDTQFFTRFADGVPIYTGKQEIIFPHYSLVHIDAQHTLEAVLRATRFILGAQSGVKGGRHMNGTCLCYDDVFGYDHDAVERILLVSGYELIRRGANKALYRRQSA